MPGPMPEKMTEEQMAQAVEMMRAQVPALQTQAQYNAFMAAFDAFRFKMNAIFSQDEARDTEASATLETAYDVARKITQVQVQLRDVPEVAGGAAAAMFTKAPVELQEHDVQRSLLSELEKCETLEELNDWYNATPTKERRDRVISQQLRNVLLDTVRAKKNALTPKETA